LPFGWLKGIWAIGRWEEPKSPEIPLVFPLTHKRLYQTMLSIKSPFLSF
jgi:hypothetical protein